VLVRVHVLWHFPSLERVQGVLDGVPRGPVGPPGPPELAALAITQHTDRSAVLQLYSKGATRPAKARSGMANFMALEGSLCPAVYYEIPGYTCQELLYMCFQLHAMNPLVY
jgi:hypothetical protein